MRGKYLILAGTLGSAILIGSQSRALASEKLFRAASEAQPAIKEIGVIRSRTVQVNFDSLVGAVMAFDGGRKTEALELNLFPDRSFKAVLDHVNQETPVNFSWVGKLEGVENSQVVFVVGGGNLTGSISTSSENYRVKTVGGTQVVEQIDVAAFPREADPIPVPPKPGAPFADLSGAVDDGSTFDLLVVYTPAARDAVGGTSAIQNLITLGVTETNVAYSNSAIIPRLHLVQTVEVNYVETANISIDLDRLSNPADGFLDEIQILRDKYKTDLVQLVVSKPLGGCGIAFLMEGDNNSAFSESAFSVSSQDCISPNYTFGHELGHNMGCNHAPADPTGTGAFSFSFGFKDPLNRFRTVMAYDCTPSCPRVLQFSNPAVFYMGLPTGTATQNNAQTINNVRKLVANFRSSR
ncbi:MAG: peptidyl-Asp metalloendopeptidase [Acidobacteriota bacterium]|jgi:hypothetical protein|nr:peptidyl-Asp metalloendopeptidase [Acidobacteriota bacterium]